MEFMIKTQAGNLLQMNDFTKSKEKPQIFCNDKGIEVTCWAQNYKTEKRRDEVFEQLESWICTRMLLNLRIYDSTPEAAEINRKMMIFEFPKE